MLTLVSGSGRQPLDTRSHVTLVLNFFDELWRRFSSASFAPSAVAIGIQMLHGFQKGYRRYAGTGGVGRLGVPNRISVIALMLRFP
jgi:hypothetical protein